MRIKTTVLLFCMCCNAQAQRFDNQQMGQDSTNIGANAGYFATKIPNSNIYRSQDVINTKKNSYSFEGPIVCGTTNAGANRISLAYCPSQFSVIGGGYRIVSYNSGGNAPDVSEPAPSLNAWSINAGGFPNACFKPVVVCQ